MGEVVVPALTRSPSQTRDLERYLEAIWRQYFFDIERVNEVRIAYGQPWKLRLGLIRLAPDRAVTFIGINALLQHEQVPECVLVTTIAHELAHYCHGFGSPLPRRYEHPHANDVVNRELEQRGLGQCRRDCDAWIDLYWFPFYAAAKQSGWPGMRKIS